jgi:hypothetical protein
MTFSLAQFPEESSWALFSIFFDVIKYTPLPLPTYPQMMEWSKNYAGIEVQSQEMPWNIPLSFIISERN